MASSWFPNLLATTSSRTMRFFHVAVHSTSTKSEGETKFLFYKRMPIKISGGKSVKPYEAKNATKAYFFATWIKKNLILSGSLNGELVCGDITFDASNEDSNDNKKEANDSRRICVNWRIAGGDASMGHTRAIQSITFFQNQVLTHSVDRYLCLWSFPNLKNVFTISTFGGSIYDIDISPVSKSWVAIASGGGFLYVWNCALAESSLKKEALGVSEEKHDDRFRMQHIWQGGKVKVGLTELIRSWSS